MCIRDSFHFDPDAQMLIGSETGLEIGIGQRVTVRLTEAVPTTGGLMLELVELEGKALSQGPRKGGKRGRPLRRKPTQARLSEVKRAAKRKRKRP